MEERLASLFPARKCVSFIEKNLSPRGVKYGLIYIYQAISGSLCDLSELFGGATFRVIGVRANANFLARMIFGNIVNPAIYLRSTTRAYEKLVRFVFCDITRYF